MPDDLRFWSGRADEQSIATVARLFREVGDPKNIDLLRWQYATPAGPAYLSFAHTGDDVHATAVAVYVVLPFQMTFGPSRRLGVQSIDTLTLPSHRGLGLVATLAERVYSAAAADGAVAVFGFPNGSFHPIATGRLRWVSLDPLPLLVRPIGMRYMRRRLHLRRAPCRPWRDSASTHGASGIRRVPVLPPDVGELCAEATDARIGVERDGRYLEWRTSRVGVEYLIMEARSPGGAITAVGIASLEPKHGCNLGYVIDVVARDDDRRDARRMLKALIRELRVAGADLVLGWGFRSDWRRLYAHGGFVPFPSRLRPFELHVGVRPLSGDGDGWPFSDRDRWHMSYTDSDTV